MFFCNVCCFPTYNQEVTFPLKQHSISQPWAMLPAVLKVVVAKVVLAGEGAKVVAKGQGKVVLKVVAAKAVVVAAAVAVVVGVARDMMQQLNLHSSEVLHQLNVKWSSSRRWMRMR